MQAVSTTAYESISTVTVGSGGTTSITFSSIPATYTHLQIRSLARGLNPNAECQGKYQFNGDTSSNYHLHGSRTEGSVVYTFNEINQTSIGGVIRYSAANAAANNFGVGVTDIFDYANTNKNKTMRSVGGSDQGATNFGQVYFTSGLWVNTSAITSINIANQDGSGWAEYSSFALYGIKGA
jgi:hypothetical protein